MKIALISVLLFMAIGCSNSNPQTTIKEHDTTNQHIKFPLNVISVKSCEAKGGKVWNIRGETSYKGKGKLIGKIEEFLCHCFCLVEAP